MTEAELTFEQAFGQLEAVVQQLEGGELSLEQSLALFETGMRLAKLCAAKLDQAEQKVSKLSGIGGENLTLGRFEPEA